VATENLPLAGVRIADFTHGVAGPYAVMLLADLGADVWKVEKPDRGDPTRYMNVSEKFGSDIPRSGGDYFLAINRNKRSVAIDLRQESGREAALRLVAEADLVISNFRPGVMDRLGLGYEACRQVRPDVIYASLSAYGENGPLASQPGMDVAVQARSGVMSITGHGDSGPAKPGASIADFSGGAHLTVAVLAALYQRKVTGEGQELHVALLDSMMSMLSNYSVAVIDGEEEIQPMGSGHPQLVPFQAFPTSDGHIVIATGTNRLFRDLCDVLQAPEIMTDPRFATNNARVANRAAIVALITAKTSMRTTDDWISVLERAAIPCSPVNTLSQAFSERQLLEQGMVEEMSHPVYGSVHAIGAPYTFSGSRPPIRKPPPLLGEHTEEVLSTIAGLGPDAIAALSNGVVTAQPTNALLRQSTKIEE